MPTFLGTIKVRSDYKIPFVQLEFGSHNFDYQIDASFFERMPVGLVQDGKVHVLVEFHKLEGLFNLTYSWDGYLNCICDNCLDDIQYPIKNTASVQVKIQQDAPEDEPDLIYISPNEQQLDVYQMIYDFLVLDLPMRKLCANWTKLRKECNPKVVDILTRKKNPESTTDARWDKLKKLIIKDDYGSPEA